MRRVRKPRVSLRKPARYADRIPGVVDAELEPGECRVRYRRRDRRESEIVGRAVKVSRSRCRGRASRSDGRRTADYGILWLRPVA